MAKVDRSKTPSVEGLREDIARLIDPEAVNGYDKAYVEHDGFMQLQYIGRLTSARQKAETIISMVMVRS